MIQEYLQTKGLIPEVIDDFQICWMSDGNLQTYSSYPWLTQASEFLRTKVAKYRKEGTTEAFFVPVFSLYEELVGVQVRRLNGNSSHDSSTYEKAFHLYNLHKAYSHILEKDQVIVTEGQFDAIGLFKAGVKNTVAVLGVNLSDIQFNLLTRFTKNIVLALDNDKAGINKSRKLIKTYRNHANFALSFISEDPDTFVYKFGKEAFDNSIKTEDQLLKEKLIAP